MRRFPFAVSSFVTLVVAMAASAQLGGVPHDPPALSLRRTGVEKGVESGVCAPSATRLCLNGRRFTVEVEWRDFTGATGEGQAVTAPPSQAGAETSGLFWFFASENWELLVKVLDGCAVNDRFWVFSAATTNVEYTLRVTEEATGEIREYLNPLGNAASAVTDTDAFATCPDSTVKPDLLVFANPSVLTVLGTSTITVIARDAKGPLGPGHRVRLIADLGTVPRTVFTDVHGEVEATFTAGDLPGIGSVTAILGASEPATVELSIRDAPSNLVLTAFPAVIESGVATTIELTAIVADPRGLPLSNILVTFTSEIGRFERGGSLITDVRGMVSETLIVTPSDLPPGGTSFRVGASAFSELGILTGHVVIRVQ